MRTNMIQHVAKFFKHFIAGAALEELILAASLTVYVTHSPETFVFRL